MNAAAFTAAIAAAQHQQVADALTEQLRKAGATSARTAIPLETNDEATAAALKQLIASGHVRDVGGGRHWLDQEAIKRTTARAGRIAWIVLAFLVSAGISVAAILLTR